MNPQSHKRIRILLALILTNVTLMVLGDLALQAQYGGPWQNAMPALQALMARNGESQPPTTGSTLIVVGDTPTAIPTATNVPATNTPKPMAAAPAAATATFTPKPAATATNTPANTATPKPAATKTPPAINFGETVRGTDPLPAIIWDHVSYPDAPKLATINGKIGRFGMWWCVGGDYKDYWLYLVAAGWLPTQEQARVPYVRTRDTDQGHGYWTALESPVNQLPTTAYYINALKGKDVDFWVRVTAADVAIDRYPVYGCKE